MIYRETSGRQNRPTGRRKAVLFFALALGVSACDSVLEVKVPGQITEEAAFVPEQAEVLMNSAVADIECGLSDFIASNAAGSEDASGRNIGWWGQAYEFAPTPGTANCSTAETSFGWFVPLHKGRWVAEQLYQRLATEWTDDLVVGREEKMAVAAIYAGITYTLFGEYFCEVTANTGPLLSWKESLEEADRWFTLAIQHIQTTGDFAIATGIAPSALQMTHLLRARARFAMDDFAGAESDALLVQEGFIANITRESGGERVRWNRVNSAHVGQGDWVPVLGPIYWWNGPADPVTGEAWPDTIPFTGYWDLGVLADGRAIGSNQQPVSKLLFPEASLDPRVPVLNSGAVSGTNQYPLWQPAKYPSLDSDIPLAKWEEAWLIRAQIAYLRDSNGAAAIDLVNEIRDAHGLPLVTYLTPGDLDGVEDMLIEEIRRTHYLEGRFWATKLRYDLWFPRGQGSDLFAHSYNTAVRLVMPDAEFTLNPNVTEQDQGSMCPVGESPV